MIRKAVIKNDVLILYNVRDLKFWVSGSLIFFKVIEDFQRTFIYIISLFAILDIQTEHLKNFKLT